MKGIKAEKGLYTLVTLEIFKVIKAILIRYDDFLLSKLLAFKSTVVQKNTKTILLLDTKQNLKLESVRSGLNFCTIIEVTEKFLS